MNTVSYREERPIATRHDEASWAKNRRAEFVVDLFPDDRKSLKTDSMGKLRVVGLDNLSVA